VLGLCVLAMACAPETSAPGADTSGAHSATPAAGDTLVYRQQQEIALSDQHIDECGLRQERIRELRRADAFSLPVFTVSAPAGRALVINAGPEVCEPDSEPDCSAEASYTPEGGGSPVAKCRGGEAEPESIDYHPVDLFVLPGDAQLPTTRQQLVQQAEQSRSTASDADALLCEPGGAGGATRTYQVVVAPRPGAPSYDCSGPSRAAGCDSGFPVWVQFYVKDGRSCD
jgi:hypothetical protein